MAKVSQCTQFDLHCYSKKITSRQFTLQFKKVKKEKCLYKYEIINSKSKLIIFIINISLKKYLIFISYISSLIRNRKK